MTLKLTDSHAPH